MKITYLFSSLCNVRFREFRTGLDVKLIKAKHEYYHDALLLFCIQTSDLSIGYNLISIYAGACDWLSRRKCTCWWIIVCSNLAAWIVCEIVANVNINYRLPIKVYYRICTLRHIRIEINHGSQNVFWVLTWVGGY